MNTPKAQFPSHIFRAYDIRGNISLLTPELVQCIAYGLICQYKKAKQTKLVIGYDARLSSPYYAYLIQQECLKQGLDAVILGCCATPFMYFMARQFDGNGIMVTASHNGKTDNGIKWIIQGEPPCPSQIQQVAQDAKSKIGQLITQSNIEFQKHQEITEFNLEQYQTFIFQDIQLHSSFKVVLDGLNGSAGRCAALVLNALGCDVIELRCDANGEFPDHAPDPSHADHLEKLRQTVLSHHADLGIALDGDGDRVVLVDEQAQIISADRLLSLFAEICLAEHPEHEIVFDVKCSSMVRNTVKNLNGRAKMIRTGSSFLRKYLAQSQGKAVFGGEYAGHYVFNDGRGLGYDDGLYAALRVLEYLSQTQLTLSQALAKYPERHGTEDTYISTHHQNPKKVLKDIEILSHKLGAKMSKIDGVRLDFDDGFGIIRASNTGEYFTVRFDADNSAILSNIRHAFVDMLSDRYPEIAQDILNAQ